MVLERLRSTWQRELLEGSIIAHLIESAILNNRKELAVAAVRSPELFVELAQKVETLVQTVNGLVVVNETLIGLLTEALGSASEKGKEETEVGNGEKWYVS
jgi:hypothetical protein